MTHLSKTPAILIGALIALSWPAYGDQPPDVVQSDGAGNTTVAASGRAFFRAATPDQLIFAMRAAASSGQPATIKLAPGHYRFSRKFESVLGASALPPVRTTIAILGTDAATTIFDASEYNGSNFPPVRILTVLKAGNLRVRGVTITGGLAFCEGFNDTCPQKGGGAVLNKGILWLEHCVLSSNATLEEQARSPALGGAILSTAGRLYVDHTTVSGNVAVGNGGGVALTGGSATIAHSIISGNGTGQLDAEVGLNFGGGIYVTGGRLSIVGSTIAGNTVGDGGDPSWLGFGAGIYNGGGSVSLKDSAVTENVAFNTGSGGGIVNGGTMIIGTSTIGGNSAGTSGGGIFNGGNLTLQGVTVVHNDVRGRVAIEGVHGEGPYPPGCEIGDEGPTPECISSGGGIWNEPSAITRIATSVIAGNASVAGNGPDCDGVLISEGHNALGVDSGCKLQPSRTNDQVNLDPRIGELDDDGEAGNGHYPLLADSPLIDTGGKNCSLPRDQLGNRRADGDGDGHAQCDVGAIEFRTQ